MDQNKKIETLVKMIKVSDFKAVDRINIRNHLLQHIEENPAVSILDLVRQQHRQEQFSFSSLLLIKKTMLASIIIALIIATSGVTSVAAEGALPGDILYPVKININEEVRSAFNLSTDAKANWEAELTSRRLQEAEKLAVENRLQADTQGQLRQAIENHFTKFNQLSAKLAQHNDAEKAAAVQSKLESILKAHAEVLLGMDSDTQDSNLVSALAADVLDKAKSISEDRGKNEEDSTNGSAVDNQAAAEGKQQAAQNKVDEVAKLIASRKDRIGATVYQEASARLNDAITLVNDGQIKLSAGAYGEAFANFQEATRKAQEAQVIVNASESLKVDLKIKHEDRLDDNATSSDSINEIDRLLNQANGNLNLGTSTGKVDIGIKAGDDEGESDDSRNGLTNQNINSREREDEREDNDNERNRGNVNVNLNASLGL
ncbi:MAG: DUF5667 domain-containing protein [Patescibacteria group bacterium]|nr:DUF5667 domain-containing protein [Patescibacteria group bacterium]